MKYISFIHPVTQSERAGVITQPQQPGADTLVYDIGLLTGLQPNGAYTLIEYITAGAQETLQTALRSADADTFALPLRTLRLLSPVPNPPSVRDFYAFEQHVRAARARRNAEMIPEWYQFPVFYFSNPAAIQGHNELIEYPQGSQEMDFELEIACVIGKTGKDIPAENASEYIFGYMVMNDWSARDLQREEMRMSLGPAKGKDFATSLGPWLTTPDELADCRIGAGAQERYDLAITGSVNGKEVSRANFKDMYFTFPQILERASQRVTLRPGDIIGSGTVGTGCILELGPEVQPWLQPGDVVEMEIERLGILRNQIVISAPRQP